MQKIISKNEPCLKAKYSSFPFQSEAVDFIKSLEYGALFHEQGLGKSKIAIDLMLYWLQQKEVDTVLFVAKKTLLKNWEKEFLNHTHIEPGIISQDGSKNYYIFNSPCRIMLTHYEVFNKEKERLKLFLKSRNVAVILDESTKIKNPESSLTQCFFELAPLFKKRIIMSGTPVANRPYDIWAQIFFLDQGKSLGSDFKTFKNIADLKNDFDHDSSGRDDFENFIKGIYNKIQQFCVRETKESGGILLPQKKYLTLFAEWETYQLELYDDIIKEEKAYIVKNGYPSIDDMSSILKRLLRLVQVTSNPKLVDESYVATPGKLQTLIELVENIVRKGEKCIVWTSFIENVQYLAEELKHISEVKKIYGKMDIQSRNSSVESFINDPNVKVLIATPGAAKEGLTLTVANHVIFYDRTFSLDDYLQSQDRIHRISQKRECFIYNIRIEGSIDDWVDELIGAKAAAAKLTQGDITIDEYRKLISYEFGRRLDEILNIN